MSLTSTLLEFLGAAAGRPERWGRLGEKGLLVPTPVARAHQVLGADD
jgi:hypothetical protein